MATNGIEKTMEPGNALAASSGVRSSDPRNSRLRKALPATEATA
jgi:hypothetical protein